MDRTLGIFSASTLVLFLITAVMVSSPTGSHTTASGVEGAILVANGFITSDATYKFDGMKDTLNLDVTGTYPDPNTYEVTGDFISAHGGYGDRTGMVVTEALTPHDAKIVVSNGQIISAVMDGSYDMVAQKALN